MNPIRLIGLKYWLGAVDAVIDSVSADLHQAPFLSLWKPYMFIHLPEMWGLWQHSPCYLPVGSLLVSADWDAMGVWGRKSNPTCSLLFFAVSWQQCFFILSAAISFNQEKHPCLTPQMTPEIQAKLNLAHLSQIHTIMLPHISTGFRQTV